MRRRELNYIRKRVLEGDLLFGIGATLGSSLTVEMIAQAGYDWVWIDCEHGVGDHSELIAQMQAVSIGQAAAVVRIAWNEAPRFKRVLDLGAAGIMVPYVNTAAEAEQAVRAMRYPPMGVRGVAKFTRACGFGEQFGEYFVRANDNLLTVVQIETAEAVHNAEAIAAVDGVDVLFIGPLDLSVNMGIAEAYEHPDFVAAMGKVVSACRHHGKAAGILAPSAKMLDKCVEGGFTFLVVGSDGAILAKALHDTANTCAQLRSVWSARER